MTPVLDRDEAADHPHNAARGTFMRVGDVMQAAPAPRFSRTAACEPSAPGAPGADTDDILAEVGYSAEQVADLRSANALR